MKKIILSIAIIACAVFAQEQTKFKPDQSIAKTQTQMLEEIKTQTTLSISDTYTLQQIASALVEKNELERERLKFQQCALVSTRYGSASKLTNKYCGFLDKELQELNKQKTIKK